MNINIQLSRYKTILFGASLLLGLFPAMAQQVDPPQSNVPVSTSLDSGKVPYYGLTNLAVTSGYNYIRTIVPDQPLQSLPGGANFYRQSTTYFDGLGRPLQTVSRKAHADGSDIVEPKVYDNLGREMYHYLPYATVIGGIIATSAIGNMKLNVSTQLRGFYDQSGNDEHPYSQTILENSQLGRPLKTLSPGRNWIGSGRGISYNYFTNTNWTYNDGFYVGVLGGGFPRWTIASTPGSLPVYAGQYGAGQLFITLTTDEDGKSSMEMKDKEGHLVMKLAGLTTKTWGATARPLDYAYTCYIYDEIGRLRCVLPPEAAKPIATDSHGSVTWNNINSIQMNGLCFSNLYDNHSRIIEKKLPGKAVDYYVYDQRDRMVLSQDGNLRAQNKWMFTLYDGLGRNMATGTAGYGPSVIRETIQGYVNQGPAGIPSNNLLYYINNLDLIHVYPPTNLANCQMLTYSYYDDYSQLSGLNFDPTQFNGITLPVGNTVVPSVLSNITRGFATGTKSRILDPDNPSSDVWLTTAIYYDVNGRVIQSVSQNIQNDIDVNSSLYYFQGMLWKNIQKHKNHNAVIISGATDGAITEYTITDTYERNFAHAAGNDLVAKRTQKINGEEEYILSNYSYDHLGRNTVRQWTAGLSLNEYNIRGFQTHTAYRKYDLDTVFNENISYDTGFASKFYNGNVAGITWWGADHKARAYGYSYDGLNRLIHAEFNQYDNNGWNKSAGIDFTASNISYDLNGNIKTLNQMAPKPLATGSILMDALTYKYASNSNQLFNVKDPTGTYLGLPDFKDDLTGNDTIVQEYFYDANGNLQRDLNKQISSITYNYLNKPEKVTIDGKGVITYTYDAIGNKLRKKLTYAGNVQPEEIWDYMGNLIYKNNELQYILNEEGRARPMLASNDSFPNVPVGEFWTKYVYDYFVKDYLGNVRSTINSRPNGYNYVAAHNISTANVEDLIFDNIEAVRDNKPGSTTPDDMAARLNGAESDHRIGTAIMLRTKPGDRFTINVKAFYDGEYNQDQEVSSSEILESLMGTLLGGHTIGTKPAEVSPANQALIRNIFSDPSLPRQLDNLQQINDTKAPKAHLNYLWFDDRMKFVAASSGSVQVSGNPNVWTEVNAGGNNGGNTTPVNGDQVAVPGNGFLIVYLDNQSIGKDVWFDNLSIGNNEGVVTEEDHYYPLGLTMNITPTTVGKNPYKLTTKELESTFDLNLYDFGGRQQDMQTSRWLSIDPLAEKYYNMSPYSFCGNNPVIFIDEDGKKIVLGISRKGGEMDDDYKARRYAYLAAAQSLTNDRLDFKGNEIVIVKTAEGELDKPVGTQLMRNLIDGVKQEDGTVKTATITIYEADADVTKTVNQFGMDTKEAGDNSTNGIGTDSRVGINLNNRADNPNPYQGGIQNTDCSYGREPKFGLAHEFIHTLHNLLGINKRNETSSVVPPESVSGKMKISEEELKTRKDENSIRDEQGAVERQITK